MKSHYPRLRFVDTNTLKEQFEHIRQEFEEADRTQSLADQDAELSDLEQSIQTYFYMRAERDGIDIDAVRAATIEKNRARGYESSETYCGMVK